MMTDELFHKIIKEGKELGIHYFNPYMNGEFFTHPHAYEWLDYMEKERVWFSIFTNAERMDAKKLSKYRYLHIVNCSLNAATKETHRKIMRGPNFDTCKRNIEELISLCPKKRISVSMVVDDNNVGEVEEFKKTWGERAVISPYWNYVGARTPPASAVIMTGKRCKKVSHSFTILWDGRVNLCCLDYDGQMIFGDLNKESMKDIMVRRDVIRRLHRKGNFNMAPCNVCNYNSLRK